MEVSARSYGGVPYDYVGSASSNKFQVFDMNRIGNKLAESKLITPSTRAFEA